MKLQQNDPELDPLFKIALESQSVDNTSSYYFLSDGILMRSWRNPNVPNVPSVNVTQIVVPKILRSQLLKVAHDIPAAGHLGVKKTLQRLQSHFYWNTICRDVNSVPITGFVTPFGHYEWHFMPFGLRNAPATFSRLASKLVSNFALLCAAYLDDIAIFSNTWEEHLTHVRQVLTRIREAGLTLNLSKCEFAKAELDYLGHHIGLGKVQPRAKKVEALLRFERPTNRKQLQQYLGLAGYYKRFYPHYADVASVLSDLLKKGQRFVWTDAHERAFLDIKSRIATRPILRPPDFTQPFCMAVDSSDVAIGANLFQTVDGVEHPICFLSKKLDVHQRKYSTVEKEALGLILAVRAFSVYFGSTPVTVFTDHSPLVFINRMANHNQKLLRWSLELSQYNLTIVHRRGRDNVLPDILSRPPE